MFHKLKIITRNKMCKVGEKSEKYKTKHQLEHQRYEGGELTIVVKKMSVTDVHMRAQNNPEYCIFQMKPLLPKSMLAGTSSTMSN
jgi:hypothetical protein